MEVRVLISSACALIHVLAYHNEQTMCLAKPEGETGCAGRGLYIFLIVKLMSLGHMLLWGQEAVNL